MAFRTRRPDRGTSLGRVAALALVGAALVGSPACGPGLREAAAADAEPEGDLLPVIDDERSLELRIGKYLARRELSYRTVDRDGDLFVVVPWDGGGDRPDYEVIIDSQVSARSTTDDSVTSRVILLHLYSRVSPPVDQVADVLIAVNEHNATDWAGSFFLNPRDFEIEAVWAINIPKDSPVPLELVYDALLRIVKSWNDLHDELQRAQPSRRL